MDHEWRKDFKSFPSVLDATYGPGPRKWVWICDRCGSMTERSRVGMNAVPPTQLWRLGAYRATCDDIIIAQIQET